MQVVHPYRNMHLRPHANIVHCDFVRCPAPLNGWTGAWRVPQRPVEETAMGAAENMQKYHGCGIIVGRLLGGFQIFDLAKKKFGTPTTSL